MNINKTIILLGSENHIGVWIKEMEQMLNSTVDIYVLQDSNTITLIDKLFLKLNYFIFNKPNTLKKIDKNIEFISLNKLPSLIQSYNTIVNFTNYNLSDFKKEHIINFKINDVFFNEKTIIYHTTKLDDKINLTIGSKTNSYTNTVRFHPFSVSKNIDLVLHMFLDMLSIYLNKTLLTSNLIFTKDNSNNTPLFIHYVNYTLRILKKVFHSIFYNEQWVLGYNFIDSNDKFRISNINKLTPPKDRFWADPIVVEEQGVIYIFIEELIYNNKIAHLSVIKLNDDGTYSKPCKILEKNYHLSYPFVFKHEDTYYMVPETANNNDIQLYKSVSFPEKWEFVKTLITNVKASDTTLLFYNNKWWMFTSIKKYEYGTYDNDLSIFHATDLLSDTWKPHSMNPVKRNISNSRQGGNFIKKEDEIFRISQNGEVRYGYGFNINKIKLLTESLYKEETVYSFKPNKKNTKIKGIHTYSQNERIKVYDILISKFKF